MLLALPLALAIPATADTPLHPLTEADLDRTQETGCTFTFSRGNATLLQAIGRDLMIRTPQGFALCRFDQAGLDAFTGGKRPLTCGNRALQLRQTGRTRSFPESDGAGWPAALRVTSGKASVTLRGDAGVAC
ncbi:hypothetical protein [Sphingomonas sp. S2-65]|uniref:hypothetical protein n=1 Tax=Sphingomonas sp. S2-65 TaxID=2903960 RepID=UPI001F279885|nr:hypothetical protein [Sphingomonas sp. S2-65]UYY59400.1 hypothetical protein LZ586_04760 [Sphingomonas sp. S2-65]